MTEAATNPYNNPGHNHSKGVLCTSNCPMFVRPRISPEELTEARKISALTVDELLAQMTPEQTEALRANVIDSTERNGNRTIDGDEWDDEDPVPNPVSGNVTRWLHEFEKDAYNRGKNDGNGVLKGRIQRLRARNNELRKRAQGAYDTGRSDGEAMRRAEDAEKIGELRAERDELMARLSLINELVERPMGVPAVRVSNMQVFAQRMRDYADRMISENAGAHTADGDAWAHWMAGELISYVTGHSIEKETEDD